MTAPRPDCRDALDWLQSRLDGEPSPMPDKVTAHVALCSDCRGRIRAADQLQLTVSSRRPLRAPAIIAERVVATVHRDIRRRQMTARAMVVAALAAAIMLAVWVGTMKPSGGAANKDMAAVPRAPSLRAELTGAGESALALARRAAAETVGESRLFVPKIEVPPIATTAWSMASAPLDDAGKGLADGLEPVATSARRAVNLFLREAPAMAEEKKN